MGYDMRWCTRDDFEAVEIEALRVLWNEAIAVRDALPGSAQGRWIGAERCRSAGLDWDAPEAYEGRTPEFIAAQDAVMAASNEIDLAEKSYFRLNISGMGRYRDLMERFGMAFEDDPHPDFPKPEERGIDWEDVYAAKYPADYPDVTFTDEQLRVIVKFNDDVQALLDFHGRTDTPGIPLHKFGSNDGWHVLPAEAAAAVRIWNQYCEDNGRESALALVGDSAYWLRWINYLAGSVSHGGFEVH